MTVIIAEGERLWMMGLGLLWAVFLFGGFLFGREDRERARRMPAWTRMASSLALVMAGWSWFLFVQGGDEGSLAFWIALGMTLGFVGDLFMAEIIPAGDRVLGGIGAFGLGHVAYIIGLVTFGDRFGYDEPAGRWGSLTVWSIVALVGWYVVVYWKGERTFLHKVALPYALLLAATTGFATSLALQDRVFLPLAVGAALFLLSDLILAAQLFNNLRFRLIDDVVWLTYGPGQMLIVFGIALTVL